MGLEQAIEQYHRAADEFSRGDPGPVKALFSHGDDVMLANPFGPVAHGWDEVSAALDFASSRFSEGEVTNFERVASYVGEDLATMFEIERWRAKVGDGDVVETFDLRVTTTLRREDGSWRLVHRHADPITTFDPEGPLRSAP